MKTYIFKTLKTHQGYYVYARDTHTVFRIEKEEWEELKKIESGQLEEAESPVLKNFVQNGILTRNVVKEIRHPFSDYLEHDLECKMEQIILQVTQQCNLRCEYCIYSGNYETRSHSDLRMAPEIAQKAIQFAIDHSSESRKICFSFYGGEPLLEFDLIKQCVAYVKEHMQGREYAFSMTTNGTLLTPKVVDFLAENQFIVSVSLDGPKKDHDANRRFRNGKGSFDIIERNILYIKEHYREYWEKIQFLTTLNPKSDLSEVEQFFAENEMVAGADVRFNEVDDMNLKNPQLAEFEKDYYLNRQFQYLKNLMAMAGLIEENKTGRLFQGMEAKRSSSYLALKKGCTLGSCAHHGGPCIPGVRRLFVTVNGVFYTCEKVLESLPWLSIGNIDRGFDSKNIDRLLNLGRLTEDQCKTCWALQMCQVCAARIEGKPEDDFLTPEEKLKVCRGIRESAKQELYEYCVLEECRACRKERLS